MPIERRVSIALTTYNRRMQVLRLLSSLTQLSADWSIIVIDNGSTDGTAAAIAAQFPSVMLIRARRNLGTAARNIAAAYAHTPYIAFCDDDVRWDPGALERAAAILDAAPNVAVLSACVQVGPDRQLSPACMSMAQSPLPREGLPGPRLLDFMAGACVVRTRAFVDVGGYWPPFCMGGEEALMAMDMEERGWHVVYAEGVVSWQFSSGQESARAGECQRIRNEVWLAWMRRPLLSAWRKTCAQFRQARTRSIFWRTFAEVAIGMPRVLRQRRVISPSLEKMRVLLDEEAACDSQASLASIMRPSPKY